jgi:hypothetical protein
MAKAAGTEKVIFAPCHWDSDAQDTLIWMRQFSNLPFNSKEDIQKGKFDITFWEDAGENKVNPDTPGAFEITIAPSFTNLDEEFATAYYVVLRGTLEQFGLYPKEVLLKKEISQLVKKLDGGTVQVDNQISPLRGAKIEIPADPYPEWPENFTPENAIPTNDPQDTKNCLWEDTVITIGLQLNPQPMKSARPIGPAVHFGPYRNFFNRDVTITIPYKKYIAGSRDVQVYIYNHLSGDWDAVDVEKVDTAHGLVTIKTQVLGLFRAGIKK